MLKVLEYSRNTVQYCNAQNFHGARRTDTKGIKYFCSFLIKTQVAGVAWSMICLDTLVGFWLQNPGRSRVLTQIGNYRTVFLFFRWFALYQRTDAHRNLLQRGITNPDFPKESRVLLWCLAIIRFLIHDSKFFSSWGTSHNQVSFTRL